MLDEIPVQLLNQLFHERLDLKDGHKRCTELVKAFLAERLKARSAGVELLGADVSKLANQIKIYYSLKMGGAETTFCWQTTEQDLLMYDVPVTTLLDNHLVESLREMVG